MMACSLAFERYDTNAKRKASDFRTSSSPERHQDGTRCPNDNSPSDTALLTASPISDEIPQKKQKMAAARLNCESNDCYQAFGEQDTLYVYLSLIDNIFLLISK